MDTNKLMNHLEEKLDDLVTEAVDHGLTMDQVISAFETKLMGLREESEDTA